MSLAGKEFAIMALRGASPSDVDILGDLIQPRDAGAYFLQANDVYAWWWAIGVRFRPREIVEIGTRYGYSLRAITRGAGHPPGEFSLTVFDNESNPGEQGCLRVFVRYFDRVLGIRDVLVYKVDTQTQRSLGVTGADLGVVDGLHTEDGCYHDCGLVWETLRSGGVMAVDDTITTGCVRDGFERFAKEKGLGFVYLPSMTGICLMEKP